MGPHLKIVLLLCLLAVFIFVVRQIKNKKLVLQYTLSWLFLIFGLAIVILVPQVLDIISRIIGIAVPVNTIFFLGFVFALVILYNMTGAISKMSVEITRLTQELAILEKKIEEGKTES